MAATQSLTQISSSSRAAAEVRLECGGGKRESFSLPFPCCNCTEALLVSLRVEVFQQRLHSVRGANPMYLHCCLLVSQVLPVEETLPEGLAVDLHATATILHLRQS